MKFLMQDTLASGKMATCLLAPFPCPRAPFLMMQSLLRASSMRNPTFITHYSLLWHYLRRPIAGRLRALSRRAL